MNATMDVSNITQSNMQYIDIKIINTIQFHLVQFNIKISDRQLYHIISMTPNFFNCQNEPRCFFMIIAVWKTKINSVFRQLLTVSLH